MTDRTDHTKTVLANASDEDLRSELSRRKRIYIDTHMDILRAKQAWVLRHVDDLLEVVDTHSFKTCADDRVRNEDNGCDRCALLWLKELGVNEDFVADIRINKMNQDTVIEQLKNTYWENWPT